MDLSDAVRGRASIWSVDGLNSEEATDDELLEHVGLLEEIPNDSICERDALTARIFRRCGLLDVADAVVAVVRESLVHLWAVRAPFTIAGYVL